MDNDIFEDIKRRVRNRSASIINNISGTILDSDKKDRNRLICHRDQRNWAALCFPLLTRYCVNTCTTDAASVFHISFSYNQVLLGHLHLNCEHASTKIYIFTVYIKVT